MFPSLIFLSFCSVFLLSFFLSPCVLISLILNTLQPNANLNTTISAFCQYVLHSNRKVLCTELQETATAVTAVTVCLYRINQLFLLTEERCILGTVGT